MSHSAAAMKSSKTFCFCPACLLQPRVATPAPSQIRQCEESAAFEPLKVVRQERRRLADVEAAISGEQCRQISALPEALLMDQNMLIFVIFDGSDLFTSTDEGSTAPVAAPTAMALPSERPDQSGRSSWLVAETEIRLGAVEPLAPRRSRRSPAATLTPALAGHVERLDHVRRIPST
jgi:hypothetical protein